MNENYNNYISELADIYRGKVNSTKEKNWNKLEEYMGEFHLFCFLPLFSNNNLSDYKNNLSNDDIRKLLKILEPIPNESIQLLAINWRGFYLKNGRSTFLMPVNEVFNEGNRNYKWHNSLHECYMKNAGKHRSINQIFLEWKRERKYKNNYLIISFDATSSNIKYDKKYDGIFIKISQDFTKKLYNKIRIKNILNSHDVCEDDKECSDSIHFRKMKTESEEKIKKVFNYSFKKENSIINDFWKIYFKELDLRYTLQKFDEFLLSLYWLVLYCNNDFCGQHFITVRLPNILSKYPIYPDSSISVVAKHNPIELLAIIESMIKQFNTNPNYIELKNVIEEKYEGWEKSWYEASDSISLKFKEAESRYWQFVGKESKTDNGEEKVEDGEKKNDNKAHLRAPLDYNKLLSLCRIANYLKGSKHEGNKQNYIFLVGFSFDKIISLLEGAFEQVSTDIEWPKTNDFNIQNTSVEDAYKLISKWIESHSLVLQRWDNALFFDSSNYNSPFIFPANLVRIKKAVKRNDEILWLGHPSNEFELRNSLKHITKIFNGTAGIIVSDRGSSLFHKGNIYLFDYSHIEGGGKKLKWISNPEDESDYMPTYEKSTVQIKNILCKLFIQQYNFQPYSNQKETIKKWSEKISELIEAISLLGHGALIVLRFKKENIKHLLPPLNGPYWKLSETQTLDDLSGDILMFALTASLDGATEVIFDITNNSTNSEVVFRRFVNTLYTPWIESPEGKIELEADFAKINENIHEFLTFGTRHRSAIAYSYKNNDVLIITISANRLIRLWYKGGKKAEFNF